MKKRVLSLMLAFALLLAAVPVRVLAAAVEYDASSDYNVTITVLDASGDPVTGATVTVQSSSNTHQVVETGNGEYQFTRGSGFTALFSTFTVTVSADGYETGSGSVEMFSNSITITLTAAEVTDPEIPEETDPTEPAETEPSETEPTDPAEPEEPQEEVTVKIVSFMRGQTDDLRSSELLMAQVEGYSGSTAALTYKWTNDLGTTVTSTSSGGRPGQSGTSQTHYATYLYVYSSHNMYIVQNTEQEQEIYNSDRDLEGMDNMVSDGRSHDKSYSGVGFAYAAVYGANLDDERQYNTGSITVEVYDGDTLLGTATYSGFLAPDLQADLDEAVFGVFETETIAVKDLLGESAILHIACNSCSVTEASVISGSEYIAVEDMRDTGASEPAYYVTGLQKGVAQIEIAVEKGNCKFHQYTEGTASPQIHVFKKPVVTPGVTTLSLTNLDPDCTYYIGGVEGTLHEDGTYTFDGLTPSTTYEIEVHGHYDDHGTEKIVYTFVYGTTLDLNMGSVVIRLDNTLIEGGQVDVDGVVLKPLDGSDESYSLTFNEESMSYNGTAPDGTYGIYDQEGNRLGGNQELVIDSTNTTAVVNYYTVTYEPNGGTLTETEAVTIYPEGDAVTATGEIPVYSGYRFIGWSDGTGIYQAREQVAAAIDGPVVLTAQWEAVLVVFHTNNASALEGDIFRTYYPAGADSEFTLTEEGKLPGIFYDIPTFEYYIHNDYIFQGWYTAAEGGEPMDWNGTFDLTGGQDFHIYAHWIETGTVAQEDDGKDGIENNTYQGFDLIGVQIRTVEQDEQEHYGEAGTGLRFLTVLSEDVWSQLLQIHSANSESAEYGVLLCKESTAANYVDEADEDHEMKYRGTSVNGEDTSADYAYLKNAKCSGVTDHFNGTAYRLYTMVVTYKNLEGTDLEAAQAMALIARSYIGYYDANGLYRYYYNNYTGTATYHGCRASYTETYAQIVAAE